VHAVGVLKQGDVVERLAVHEDQIGKFSLFDASDPIGEPEQASVS
jgi:hypothetical protein